MHHTSLVLSTYLWIVPAYLVNYVPMYLESMIHCFIDRLIIYVEVAIYLRTY
jgi:hypothetical protein